MVWTQKAWSLERLRQLRTVLRHDNQFWIRDVEIAWELVRDAINAIDIPPKEIVIVEVDREDITANFTRGFGLGFPLPTFADNELVDEEAEVAA